MITLNHINLAYLATIAKALGDDENVTIGDLGLTETALEQMTTLIGALHTGDKIIAGDAIYSVATDMSSGCQYYQRTEPHRRDVPTMIRLDMMITEWAYCWWDAAPPTIMTPAEVAAIVGGQL